MLRIILDIVLKFFIVMQQMICLDKGILSIFHDAKTLGQKVHLENICHFTLQYSFLFLLFVIK